MQDPYGKDTSYLDWPSCAQICNGPVRPDIVSLQFKWGPTEHVLRRFQRTTSLPNLREVHTADMSFSNGPLQLFQELRGNGRSVEKLTILCTCDLGKTRHVRFDLRPTHDAGISVKMGMFTPTIYAYDILESLKGFGLTQYYEGPMLTWETARQIDANDALIRFDQLCQLYPCCEHE